MEIVVSLAVALGIAWGLRTVIAGTEHARLRRALAYQSAANSRLRAELDLVRRTLRVYDDSIARKDAEIARLRRPTRIDGRGMAELEEQVGAFDQVGCVIPEHVRDAIFGRFVRTEGKPQ